MTSLSRLQPRQHKTSHEAVRAERMLMACCAPPATFHFGVLEARYQGPLAHAGGRVEAEREREGGGGEGGWLLRTICLRFCTAK